MTQFRKFEIDAMVDGVCTKILSNADYVENQFKDSKEYFDLMARLSELKDAVIRERKAGEQVSVLRETLVEHLDSFNTKYGNEVFKLKYEYGYSSNRTGGEITFETSVNGYLGARDTIANQLAVALLPSDAKDNIMQIISDIADKYIVDLS